MQTKLISKDSLAQFVDSLIKSGKTVIAPKLNKNKLFFGKVNSFNEIVMDYVQTALSAKSVLFPRNEELINFKYDKDNSIVMQEVEPLSQEVIVFGIKPCDAASLEYLSAFFLNENTDVHFKKRLENTTFISLSCDKSDDYCFCTSVGLNPGNTNGSDIQLTQIENGNFYVEVISEKGNKLVSQNQNSFKDTQAIDKSKYLADVPIRFSLDKATNNTKLLFEDPLWKQQSLACLSCGACAAVCPSCTCFDIQENTDIAGGSRVRCWDTCAIGLFTLHASGHNPRSVQSQRWRQRIKHKFEYTNQNFGMLSCYGCGRCARVCPAQMNIVEQIIVLEKQPVG